MVHLYKGQHSLLLLLSFSFDHGASKAVLFLLPLYFWLSLPLPHLLLLKATKLLLVLALKIVIRYQTVFPTATGCRLVIYATIVNKFASENMGVPNKTQCLICDIKIVAPPPHPESIVDCIQSDVLINAVGHIMYLLMQLTFAPHEGSMMSFKIEE